MMHTKVCANNYADFIQGIYTRSVLQFKRVQLACLPTEMKCRRGEWWICVFIINFLISRWLGIN
jgi:hypothetical protein